MTDPSAIGEPIVITYTDSAAIPIDATSIKTSNITVTGGPASATLNILSATPDGNANSPTRAVTYTALAPNGNWKTTDDGTYTIGLVSEVKDTSNNTVPANPSFGNFTVNVTDAAPTAQLTTASDVTASGTTSEKVVVTYLDRDGTPVKGSTIGTSNITVTGPGGPLTVSAITPASPTDNATEVVTYTVNAPTGGFTNANNGTYTIGLANNVTDTASNAVAANANFGTFKVNIGASASALTATLTQANNITVASGTTESVIITYVDNTTPVKGASLATSNITVTGPSGPLTVSAITPATNTDGPTKVVTYTVQAPNNQPWSAADAGVYTIGLANTVTDTSNNAITPNPNFGTFTVQLGDAPFATLNQPATVTTPGAVSEPIVIVYTDPGPSLINVSTIAAGNITVTGPGNTTLTVQSVTETPAVNAATVSATYTVLAPGGTGFDSTTNGTYTIGLNNTVKNTGGTAITANPNLGTFVVNVAVSTRPIASLTPPAPISAVTASPEQIIITYTDQSSPISVASIAPSNITVTGPAGTTLTVNSATPDVNANGPTRIVTYSVNAPAGSWTSNDDGLYTIGLNPTVLDVAGSNVAANPRLGTFQVNIADTIPPTATGTVANIDTSNSATHPVIVVYTDNIGIRTSDVSTSNLTVTGPNGVSVPVVDATLAPGTLPTAKTVTVTYLLEEPNFVNFTAADNGTYTVALVGGLNGVHDTAGNPVAANPNFLSFIIDIQNTVRPTAAIIVNGIGTSGQATVPVSVIFTDPVAINVSSIRISDFTITSSDGRTLEPAGLAITPTSNAPVVTATFFIKAPHGVFNINDNGVYTISVTNVTDTTGLLVDPTTTTAGFIIDVPTITGVPFALGQAGVVNGKTVKLKFRDIPDGTDGVLTITNGTGTLFQEGGNNQLDLVVNATSSKPMTITARTSHGGPLTFKDIIIHGNVKSFTAPTTNITGTFFDAGSLKTMSFMHLIGTFAVSGTIGTLSISRAVTNSLILSGADLGANNHLGGGDDAFAPGFIGTLKIGGQVVGSVIAAGDNPGPDGVFGTSDDVRAGSIASTISNLSAATTDANSRYVAGVFGKFKIGRTRFRPNPAADHRFIQI